MDINDSYRRRSVNSSLKPIRNNMKQQPKESGTHVWKRDLQENGPSCHDRSSIIINLYLKSHQTHDQTLSNDQGMVWTRSSWGMPPQILMAETSVKSPKLVELKKAIGLSEIPSTSTFELRGFVVFGYEASVFCREFPKITKKKSDSWHFHTSSPRFPGCLVEQRKPCPYEATQEM